MSSKYLTLDERLCGTCKGIADKFPADKFPTVIGAGVNVLDGSITSESIQGLMEQSSDSAVASVAEMEEIVKASGSLIWEFVKSNSLQSMEAVLAQVGFSAELASAFGKCGAANKFRLSNLKKTLAISSKRYLDMEWRLDIEIARRNMSNHELKPKFMVRLDFTTEDHSSVSSSGAASVANNLSRPVGAVAAAVGGVVDPSEIESLHFEVDYANMKNLQRELELALEQMNSLHCQRFAKYIS